MTARMSKAWLVAPVLLTVALSGCLLADPSPGTPPAGPGIAVQPGVEDPVRRVVHVTAEPKEGPPVENATVVFFNATAGSHWSPPSLVYPEELPCDGRTDLAESPHWTVLAAGTTDADGRVVGLVDPQAAMTLSVAVGGVPGFTTEAHVWGTAEGGGERGCFKDLDFQPWSDGEQHVPLYRTQRPVSMQGEMPAAVSAAFSGTSVDLPRNLDDPAWDARELAVHEDERANLGYVARMTDLELALAWNNTATAYGDLYLVAGPSYDLGDAVAGGDDRQLPGSGQSRETLDLDVALWSQTRLYVGPATNSTVVALDGLSWKIAGTATFAGAPVILDGAG